MKTPSEEINGTFFLAFMGQEIIITTDIMNTIVTSTENGFITETTPVFYEGILLDEDSEYFYLGQGPNEITEAVSKARKVAIQIKNDSKLINQVFDQMPDPQTEEEIN